VVLPSLLGIITADLMLYYPAKPNGIHPGSKLQYQFDWFESNGGIKIQIGKNTK
jgi:hypothetical protein